MLIYLLVLPLAVALAVLVVPGRMAGEVNLLGAGVSLALGLAVAFEVFAGGPIEDLSGALRLDALGALLVGIITVVGFFASAYSVGYMKHELESGAVGEKKLKRYYLGLQVFIFTMLIVPSVSNLGMMWAAVEATTLASALLVGFYGKKSSIEAAWKYVIVCTVGITFALLGTVFLYAAAGGSAGGRGLFWPALVSAASAMDPKLLKLAFVFALVGYGTKAGLVPMHTWLPDAHSQAPTPISALLSGVLLNCAVYGIIRFHTLASLGLGPAFSSNLLLYFGLASMGVAAPFILLQHDFKRLLAYSSVEHIGIIAAGIGFGGTLGLYGAMLHMVNHALAKSLLFFLVGDITQKYGTRKIRRIEGLLRAMPITGTLFLAAIFAITGSPPFGVFLSEITILSAGFARGSLIPSALFILFVALVFTGAIYYAGRMAFGGLPRRISHGEGGRMAAVAAAVPMLAVLALGLYVPPYFSSILNRVVDVIRGAVI